MGRHCLCHQPSVPEAPQELIPHAFENLVTVHRMDTWGWHVEVTGLPISSGRWWLQVAMKIVGLFIITVLNIWGSFQWCSSQASRPVRALSVPNLTSEANQTGSGDFSPKYSKCSTSRNCCCNPMQRCDGPGKALSRTRQQCATSASMSAWTLSWALAQFKVCTGQRSPHQHCYEVPQSNVSKGNRSRQTYNRLRS